MARKKLSKADGKFKVSDGAAQIQVIGKGWIGVSHSSEVDVTNVDVDFLIYPSGIEYSLGSTPCYVEVQSDGEVEIAYMDIS